MTAAATRRNRRRPARRRDLQRRTRDTRPLRLITCGSVDDGKSTLIGRLLWDTKAVKEDQAATLQRDSTGKQNDLGLPDFALLLDGLQAEREQGITIDVAYRYFSTDKRSFIVADTPGHEQYTRNMATGASTADLAILLVDARAGILEQTRRHATIASLLGIKQFVLAVNKIDLTNYDRAGFDKITHEFQRIRAVARRQADHRDPDVGAEGRERRLFRRSVDALVCRPDAGRNAGAGHRPLLADGRLPPARCSASRAPAKASAAIRARLPAARSSRATAS